LVSSLRKVVLRFETDSRSGASPLGVVGRGFFCGGDVLRRLRQVPGEQPAPGTRGPDVPCPVAAGVPLQHEPSVAAAAAVDGRPPVVVATEQTQLPNHRGLQSMGSCHPTSNCPFPASWAPSGKRNGPGRATLCRGRKTKMQASLNSRGVSGVCFPVLVCAVV